MYKHISKFLNTLYALRNSLLSYLWKAFISRSPLYFFLNLIVHINQKKKKGKRNEVRELSANQNLLAAVNCEIAISSWGRDSSFLEYG